MVVEEATAAAAELPVSPFPFPVNPLPVPTPPASRQSRPSRPFEAARESEAGGRSTSAMEVTAVGKSI